MEIILGIIIMVAFPFIMSGVAIVLLYLVLELGHGIAKLDEQIQEEYKEYCGLEESNG